MKVAVCRNQQPLIAPFVKVTVIWNAKTMRFYAVYRALQSIKNNWFAKIAIF